MARSRGKMMATPTTNNPRAARALWYARKGIVELRHADLPSLEQGEARVRTHFSGISRGTERLVFEGGIGQSEWTRMRCPMQEGAFPFPVKYGYGAAGVVEEGPPDLVGKHVFCLHPHQDIFNAPVSQLAVIPDEIPLRRATLSANMETALNAVWDSGAGPGDRVVVVGAGVVGLLVASLAARLPEAVVTAVDVDDARRAIVESLGAGFARPEHAPGDADVVFHTSASSAGLNTAIQCAGLEAAVVEMSWYGSQPVQAELGGAFHSRRLQLVSSQVGRVPARRSARWDFPRRRETALRLLAAPALDALVAEEIAFEDAPRELPGILGGGTHGLAPVIRYPVS